MDLNFCSPGLTVTVKSSCVSRDGYEVDNLISSDFCKKQKGFLAESFIKPPVTLTFEFVCDVEINYLVIQSKVGAQKSAGLEIFTVAKLDIDSVVGQDTQLNSVASGIIRNEEIGFVFYKHGYDIRKKMPASNFLMRTFKSYRNLVTRVLTIKIFKTYGSSIPALQKVEVWGRPNSKCPKNIIDNVYDCWKQQCSQTFQESVDAQMRLHNESNNKNKCCDVYCVDFKIPDEFMDPITCEIMVLPVILPCGKAVDKFTLEKHNENESHWGRSPSDPFTGIQFSETNKPVIASDLKARIDKFLYDNNNEKILMNVPRTVGEKASSSPQIYHGVEQRNCEKHDRYCGKSSKDTFHRNCEKGRRVSSLVPSTLGNLQTSNKQINNKEIQHQRKHNIVSKNVKFSPYAQNGTLSTLSHKEMSERSLDNLLKITLSSLPSVCQTSPKENETNKCVTCKNNSNLFEMPCIHVVCRSCLVDMVNKKQLKCACCEAVFKASDVRRIHV